jgi:hypothetical protein
MQGVAGPKSPVVRCEVRCDARCSLGFKIQGLASQTQLRANIQGKYGQPVVPNLAVRHLCPNCRVDPPNIVEEYSHGDLVSRNAQWGRAMVGTVTDKT